MVHMALILIAALATSEPTPQTSDDHPVPAEKRTAMRKEFTETVAEAVQAIERNAVDVAAYSRRGDARFFLGDHDGAVADYDRMVALDPKSDVSHWRRGIAQYFAGEFPKAQRQFERYRTYDDRDPETHYWLFLSQARAEGIEKARDTLRRNQMLDAEDGPAGFRMLVGQITPQEFLDEIRAADLTETERARQRFYAHLYIGLNATIRDQPELARQHLRQAVTNSWARDAGYGPNYMWHVARLQYDALNPPHKATPQ